MSAKLNDTDKQLLCGKHVNNMFIWKIWMKYVLQVMKDGTTFKMCLEDMLAKDCSMKNQCEADTKIVI
jgi:hypothetical protein